MCGHKPTNRTQTDRVRLHMSLSAIWCFSTILQTLMMVKNKEINKFRTHLTTAANTPENDKTKAYD